MNSSGHTIHLWTLCSSLIFWFEVLFMALLASEANNELVTRDCVLLHHPFPFPASNFLDNYFNLQYIMDFFISSSLLFDSASKIDQTYRMANMLPHTSHSDLVIVFVLLLRLFSCISESPQQVIYPSHVQWFAISDASFFNPGFELAQMVHPIACFTSLLFWVFSFKAKEQKRKVSASKLH